MGKIISLVSGKGGVGKTTISINLAYLLANEYNQKTMLIDFNLTTPHIPISLEILKPSMNLAQLLKKRTELEYENMKIILPPLEGAFSQTITLSELLRKREEYEFIILDAPPGFGKDVLSVLKISERSFMVATPSLDSLLNVARVHILHTKARSKPLGLILNKVKKEEYELKKEEIEEWLGIKVIAEISFDKRVEDSLMLRMPLVKAFPNSKVSKKMKEIAEYLLTLS